MYPVYFVNFVYWVHIVFFNISCYDKLLIYEEGEIMAYSDAQKKAVKKYNEKTYDEIKLRVRKGNKNLIKQHAESNNETVNGMLNRLLENEIPEMKD